MPLLITARSLSMIFVIFPFDQCRLKHSCDKGWNKGKYLDPASAHTHSAQALDPYSHMKLFGNHKKDYAQSCHSLYESIFCTAQARSRQYLIFWLIADFLYASVNYHLKFQRKCTIMP